MIKKLNINDFGNGIKISCLMDQLSCHLVSYCSILPLCVMIFFEMK